MGCMVFGCFLSFVSFVIFYLMFLLVVVFTISGFVVLWGGESIVKEEGRDGVGNYRMCVREVGGIGVMREF